MVMYVAKTEAFYYLLVSKITDFPGDKSYLNLVTANRSSMPYKGWVEVDPRNVLSN